MAEETKGPEEAAVPEDAVAAAPVPAVPDEDELPSDDPPEEDPPVKCEECAPCKGGAPAWMATFADMATLLMAFFVLILSFAEMNVPKYKQISGSMRSAFGVQRLVPTVEPPKAQSLIAKQFSPAVAQPTPIQTVQQKTTDQTRKEVELQTSNKTEDFKDNADFRTVEQLLAKEIAEGQVEVKVEDEKIVVELTSPATSGGEGSTDDGRAQGGLVSQETLEIFAKVADAQAQVASEVAVRDQAESGQQSGDLAQSGQSQGGTGGSNSEEQLQDKLEQIRMELSEDIAKGLAEVEREGDKIIVRLAEQGSFRSGFADLQPAFLPLLDRVGSAVAQTNGTVTIAGHTDNVPIAFSERFQSNWDLSAARSAAVADYLLGNTELQQGRVTVVGYADTQPLDSNETAAGRSRNRRIEVIVDGG